MRLDLSASFDVGASNPMVPDEVLCGGGISLSLLSPELGNPVVDTVGVQLGGLLRGSAYFSEEQNFVSLRETDPTTEVIKEGIMGGEGFLAFTMAVPLADIVSLRFSPGAMFRYDDFYGFDVGAAVETSLTVDLPASAILVFRFASDIYTHNRNEKFMGGIGLGFHLDV